MDITFEMEFPASATTSDEGDRALKSEKDSGIAGNDALKRRHDEAFGEDDGEWNGVQSRIPSSIMALEDAIPSFGWRREFETAMKDPIVRSNYKQALTKHTGVQSDIGKTPSHGVQKLPDDIMISIVDIVASSGRTQQLANFALVSKRMYEIAIPKLYASIKVTDRIRDDLMYGCTPSPSAEHPVIDGGCIEYPTRKDLACNHTRTLRIHGIPAMEIARVFRHVKEVDLGPCTYRSALYLLAKNGESHSSLNSCRPVYEFLSVIAPKDRLKDPLHVHIDRRVAKRLAAIAKEEAHQLDHQTLISIAYKIKWSIGFDESEDLANVSSLQPVVCFNNHASHLDDSWERLLERLDWCFVRRDPPSISRRLLLSGVPQHVLSPEEYKGSLDPDTDTLLKLFSYYKDMNKSWNPTWEEFSSMVKLVEPGFWPSRSDLERGRRPASTTSEVVNAS